MYLISSTCNKNSLYCRIQTPLQGVREGFRCAQQSGHTYEDTHGREAIHVSSVRERLHAKSTHEVTHGYHTQGTLQSLENGTIGMM